jgi:6-phosphogluconate dehydrogenase
MQIGIVGLGRMGSNIARRLMRDGHACVAYNRSADKVAALVNEGATGAGSLAELVSALEAPRTVWVMLPAGEPTEDAVSALADLLSDGDAIIDGGNTHYTDDMRRAAALAPRGIHYVDSGTSGGVFGLERGYCLMVGADDDTFARLEPVFASLAPGVDAAPRTPGTTGEPSPAERGYLHCGPPGAGHFVKMVHNGIEYGMMGAIAEGLNILHNADAGTRTPTPDAETAPLERPERYGFDIDVAAVAELWRRGSVVASWLMDLAAEQLRDDPGLADLAGRVSDSGEGRWTLEAAIDTGVPAPVLSAALFSRFASRDNDDYANRVLSAMRRGFGGHEERH